MLIHTAFFSIAFLLECNAQNPLFSLGTLAVSNQKPNTTATFPILTNQCNSDTCVGRVWIYYSDANRVRRWGTINERGFSSHARTITCRQLGYVESDDSNPTEQEELQDPEGTTIWLTNFHECDFADPQVYNNILQCNPSLYNDTRPNHDQDLIISCANERDYRNGRDYYNGEVYLFPPREKPPGMQASFGVIQIKLSDDVKGITISSASDVVEYFHGARMDTVCKQMGYTEAVTDSVYTKTALAEFNFDANSRSWFNIDQLKDCNLPEKCFSCCFDFPDEGECDFPKCESQNVLVISCVYDALNNHPDYQDKGYAGICEYPKRQCSGTFSAEQIAIIVESVAASIFIIILLFIVIILLYKIKKRERPRPADVRYQNLQEDGDEQPHREGVPQPQEDHENGVDHQQPQGAIDIVQAGQGEGVDDQEGAANPIEGQ